MHRTNRGAGRVRLWWALPTLAVATSALAAGVVVGPTLGERVSVPRQLVLREPAAATTPMPTPGRAGTSIHPSTPVQQTHVVVPRRPVVTSTNDDGREHETGTVVESGDR